MTAEAAFSRQPVIRTSETDPTKHTNRHVGLFYTISPEDAEKWISRGLTKRAYRSFQAFNETCLMVRSPGIELTSYLCSADYSLPNVRYILYGRLGCGKSSTLAYVMHFCGRAGWFIVHEPWMPWHLRYCKTIEPSSFQPGLLDHPVYAADRLAYFRKMNEHLLSPSDGSSPPVTVNRYVVRDAFVYPAHSFTFSADWTESLCSLTEPNLDRPLQGTMSMCCPLFLPPGVFSLDTQILRMALAT